MNEPAKQQRLLSDVFSEGEDFRARLLTNTLRLVRRRKKVRLAQRSAAVVALAVGVVWSITHYSSRRSEILNTPMTPRIETVTTVPFAPDGLVHTTALTADQITVTASNTLVVNTTATSGGYRIIGDEELLALVGPHGGGLVRLNPREQRLIFVNPEDAKGFPVN